MVKLNLKILQGCAIILLLNACNKSEIVINGFVKKEWKNDSLGCNGYRKDNFLILLQNKNKLMGKNENTLIGYLGNPNSVSLIDRRKRLIYFVTPGNQCLGKKKL